MIARLTVSATLLALALAASPLHAQEDLYDDHPTHGLHFADFEFSMPRDPLLWSTDPMWTAHHTPARFLADATAQLRAAVPNGMAAEQASAVLRAAGAHCAAPQSGEMTCRYRDVETPWDYTDAVVWNVKVPLAGGHVTGLSVTRDWSRR